VIAVLAGGVGAARLLAGLVRAVPPEDVVAVVNTGDDTELHGLHVSPDLDTVTYTLAGAANPATGWGLSEETWAVMEALDRYGGIKLRHEVAVRSVTFEGAASARPAPGVLDWLAQADVVVVAPSNPIVSIAPILAVPGIAELLASRRQSVVAISPIVAGRALKGPADRLMTELGYEPSVAGVAAVLSDVAGTLVVDAADASLAAAVEAQGMSCVVTQTVMESVRVAEELALATLAAVR
jgi:2-phospho-L-lactate transferase/gluconeogenesis factor (CofD/UPF0052 family)